MIAEGGVGTNYDRGPLTMTKLSFGVRVAAPVLASYQCPAIGGTVSW
jgi:hypothetical protein